MLAIVPLVPGMLMLLADAPGAVAQAQNIAQQPTVYKTVTVPVDLANSPNAQVAVTTVALSTVTVFGSEPNSALATIVISPDAEQSSTAAISSSESINGAATSSGLTTSAPSAFPSLTANGTSFGNFTNTTWPLDNSTSATLIDPTGTDVGAQESNTAHDGKPVDTAGNAKSAAVSETHGLVGLSEALLLLSSLLWPFDPILKQLRIQENKPCLPCFPDSKSILMTHEEEDCGGARTRQVMFKLMTHDPFEDLVLEYSCRAKPRKDGNNAYYGDLPLTAAVDLQGVRARRNLSHDDRINPKPYLRCPMNAFSGTQYRASCPTTWPLHSQQPWIVGVSWTRVDVFTSGNAVEVKASTPNKLCHNRTKFPWSLVDALEFGPGRTHDFSVLDI
ncbi:uncharacterized protein B0T23DRAFT_419518 [Neurospora hispaniola]|uniref:Uncharacterized protein n=1 Tax=Neurospora hispaniola TaxID=588809 RepID=A0AAJ0IAD7_9PEZI|nr:hypothetical protein B0T23DRAFT_419518 [Neurospora hispaniola]